MNTRLWALASVAILLVLGSICDAKERLVTENFRGMERVIRAHRGRRDKLEKQRSSLATSVTKVEAVVERQLDLLDRDRKTLAALDAEIAQSNAILNELSLQQVQLIEESRGLASTLGMSEKPKAAELEEGSNTSSRNKPMPARKITRA